MAAGKLTAGLDRFVRDPAERAYIGARLGRLLGVAFAGDSGEPLAQLELFAGWRLFFERLAAEGPVALLVEDAQYADTGLLDFLDHLIDWARDLPIYVLVFARPELGQARPGFGTGRNRSTLTLDPLYPASMDALVDALVPGMPAAARAKVTSQAQGVPLFAVETIRSLIDRDIIQPLEGAYRLTGDIGELAVPGSLHALLAARLDALDPAVRRLVADAAVLGTTFPAEALTAVSGQDKTAGLPPSSMRAVPAIITSSAARPARWPGPRPPPEQPFASGATWPKRATSSYLRYRCWAHSPIPTQCTPWRTSPGWKCSPARPRRTGCLPRHWTWARPSASEPPSWLDCSTPAGPTSAGRSDVLRRPLTCAKPPGSPPR